MKNLMLTIELFLIYICAASCLIYRPKNQEKSSCDVNEQIDLAPSLEEQSADRDTNTQFVKLKESEELLNAAVSDKVEQAPSNLDTQWEVNFRLLSLAACRKIAGDLTRLDKDRLGISQKINGKDKPIEQLQQEIKSRCKHYPDDVNPVVRRRCNAKAKSVVNKAIPLTLATQPQGTPRSA